MAIIKESGRVNEQLEPCIFVEFEGGQKIELVIDTGFSGSICLPRSLMTEFGLRKISEEEIFGIGLHREVVDIAIAGIIWFGQNLEIEVLINDGDDRLLGSELLDGKVLRINYRNRNLSISEN